MSTVAFTSTRNLTDWSDHLLRATQYLQTLPAVERYITGGCVGGDSVIGRFCALKWPDAQHSVFVPEDRRQVDPWWTNDRFRHKVEVVIVSGLAPAVYRTRNTRMVTQLVEPDDVLHYIAEYPEAHGKSTRSGTWMTVRIARDRGVKTEGIVLNE